MDIRVADNQVINRAVGKRRTHVVFDTRWKKGGCDKSFLSFRQKSSLKTQKEARNMHLRLAKNMSPECVLYEVVKGEYHEAFCKRYRGYRENFQCLFLEKFLPYTNLGSFMTSSSLKIVLLISPNKCLKFSKIFIFEAAVVAENPYGTFCFKL